MATVPLAHYVERGLEISLEIKRLQEELKVINERIETAALKGEQIPLEDPQRDGMQYLAKGSEHIVPVVITADFLRGSFTEATKPHKSILEAIGLEESPKLAQFYKRTITYKRIIDDGKAFRRTARETFAADLAERFIKACVSTDKDGIPESAIKIDWSRAKSREEVLP